MSAIEIPTPVIETDMNRARARVHIEHAGTRHELDVLVWYQERTVVSTVLRSPTTSPRLERCHQVDTHYGDRYWAHLELLAMMGTLKPVRIQVGTMELEHACRLALGVLLTGCPTKPRKVTASMCPSCQKSWYDDEQDTLCPRCGADQIQLGR